MKKKTFLLLTFLFLFSSVEAKVDFVDTKDHWAREYIEDLNENQLIKGYENNTFKPDNEILNVEVYSIINKIADFNQEEEINLKDEKTAKWYYEDLKKAQAAGYVNINSDFKIEAISRLEISKIISKIYNLNSTNNNLDYFNDCDTLSLSEKNAISSLVENKIVMGYKNNFRPYGKLTRAEFSKIISISQQELKLPEKDIEKDKDSDEEKESKEKLKDLIEEAKNIDKKRYSQESISNLNAKIFNAERVLRENSDYIELNRSIEEIEEAIRRLKYIEENPKLIFNIRDEDNEKIDANILINSREFINGDKIEPGRYFVVISAKGKKDYQTYVIVDDEEKEINIILEDEDNDLFKLTLSEGLYTDNGNTFKKNERVTIKFDIPRGKEIDKFMINNREKKVIGDEFIFLISEDTYAKVIYK